MEASYKTCSAATKIQTYIIDNVEWICICSPDMPCRWTRLLDSNMEKFVSYYGFEEKNGCINSGKSNVKIVQKTPQRLDGDMTISALSKEDTLKIGLPQREKNSGMCWFAALCFVMFFSKQLKTFMLRYMPDKMKELSKGILEQPSKSELLRTYLYETFAFGDKPGISPLQEGQNGTSQFLILAARLNMPVIRLFAPEMHEMTEDIFDQHGKAHKIRNISDINEQSLLIVRSFRTAWIPHRRMWHKGRRYKLVAMMIGSEQCGHQISVSTVNMNICRFCTSCSDAARLGITPVFWSLKKGIPNDIKPGVKPSTVKFNESRAEFKMRWRSMWDNVVPITMFNGNETCRMHPGNKLPQDLKPYVSKYRATAPTPGVVNTDYFYLSA